MSTGASYAGDADPYRKPEDEDDETGTGTGTDGSSGKNEGPASA